MIGDVPKGAPLRCKIGKHRGQEKGGLMVYQCPRCGGSYWQTDPRRRAAMERIRFAEDRGDWNEVKTVAREWNLDV